MSHVKQRAGNLMVSMPASHTVIFTPGSGSRLAVQAPGWGPGESSNVKQLSSYHLWEMFEY